MGPTEILVIALIILLLFGGKKIPELFRGLGEGVREFKRGTAEALNPSEPATSESSSTAAAPEAPRSTETSAADDKTDSA